MSISLEYLERCSAETGFPVAGLEKVVRLGEMAAELGRHPFLSDALVLKGGTVLNRAFGPPERLSVDLDFNYVGAVERERMLAERPRVEQALDELARRAGYYNRSRTHLALAKDAPNPRRVHERGLGEVLAFPEVGGLHHRYVRRAA